MSINYKSKNDIPYFKFLEFAAAIEGQPPEFVAQETKRVFNPSSIVDFNEALKISGLKRLRYKIKLNYKTAGEFIDADTYYSEREYLDFFKCVLKSRIFLKKITFTKVTLAEAEYILAAFGDLKSKLRDQYEYLYNPPIRAGGGGMSPGSIERESFAEHYGPYLEMVYILTKGDFTKSDQVTKWSLDRFLFQSEYLIRKRDVENIK